MSLLGDHVEEIRSRIADLDEGAEFSFQALMGDLWEEMTKVDNPKHVGRAFSMAVQQGIFPNVVFSHVKRSPKITIWRKAA